jgi:FkbM family methyltransferase
MSILRRLLSHRGDLPAGGIPRSAMDDRATDDDVVYAYRLILKRDPDPAGLAHFRHLVAEGISLDRLIRNFVNSDEYRLRQTDETTPTPVDLGGYRVCIQKLDTDFGQCIFHSQQYEEHVRRAAREHLHQGDVAVDVGANVGVLTFLAASIVGDSGRVIAVEPNPDNLQLLYRGIVLNGFRNVEVLPHAASNVRTVFSLTGGTSNTHLIGARAPQEGGHFVQSIVLDDALGHLPRLDFVKMDIEGHEPQALEGFARMILRHRPVLLVEFNPRCLVDLHRQDPLAFLKQIFAVYRRVRVTTAFDDDEIFDSAGKVMEYWERRNREVTARQLLPDRLLHFDLVAER